MGQRLILKTTDTVRMSELEKFHSLALKCGISGSAEAEVEFDPETNSLRIMVDVPKDVKALNNRAVIPKSKSKTARAVEKQISDHAEKKANGEAEAYVPPVVKKHDTKKKCPVCNVRKPLVTVAGQKVIKPHVSKGEPCSGSGEKPLPSRQVRSKSASAKSK